MNMEKTSVKIKICLVKLYKLGNITRPKPKVTKTYNYLIELSNGFLFAQPVKAIMDDDEEEEEEEEDIALKITPDCLPEYALLDFLLDSPYTRDIKDYYAKYNAIPLIPEPKGK